MIPLTFQTSQTIAVDQLRVTRLHITSKYHVRSQIPNHALRTMASEPEPQWTKVGLEWIQHSEYCVAFQALATFLTLPQKENLTLFVFEKKKTLHPCHTSNLQSPTEGANPSNHITSYTIVA